MNSGLPTEFTKSETNEYLEGYYDTSEISYNAQEVDAVIGYFLKRGFENVSAVNTALILLQQAEIDQITVFQLLDTLKGVNDIQLSNIVARIINLNRSKTSTVGFRNNREKLLFDQRQIIV